MNKFLAGIIKSRKIQRNIVQERSFEQAGFRLWWKVGCTNPWSRRQKYKLHKSDTNLSRSFQWLDQSWSNAASFQSSIQAHSSQTTLPQNKPNFIANVDSGIDEELLWEFDKDYGLKGFYFEIPSFYLYSLQ